VIPHGAEIEKGTEMNSKKANGAQDVDQEGRTAGMSN
jgi:hypothetical protein